MEIKTEIKQMENMIQSEDAIEPVRVKRTGSLEMEPEKPADRPRE